MKVDALDHLVLTVSSINGTIALSVYFYDPAENLIEVSNEVD